jgi:hypothetical protein
MDGHAASRCGRPCEEAVSNQTDAALDRIKKLERLLAESPAGSLQHRELTQALRIETTAYRKSLDDDQAAKTFDRGTRAR